MNLTIIFNSERFTTIESFDSYGDISEFIGTTQADNYIYDYSIRPAYPIEGGEICATFYGKLIIHYEAQYKNISPDDGFDKFEDFIIGVNNNGEEVLHTCEGKKLSNAFKPIPDAPYAYTPVFFKKEVLNKYYSNPDKYAVTDGMISCKGYWSMRIDNNLDNYVAVMLIDLGRIHHKEQGHWKPYNIPREDGMVLSDTAYKSWVKGSFDAYPVAPDLCLKSKYKAFNDAWFSKYSSYLFRPLEKGDAYRLEGLHSLTSDNNNADFESQLLACTKIFVDALNSKMLLSFVKKNISKH